MPKVRIAMQKARHLDLITYLLVLLLMFSGCATAPKPQAAPEEPPQRPASEVLKPGVVYAIDAYDPWEPMNRRIYKFNARFDEYVYLPIVEAYEFVTPVFLQQRITNFFNNLEEITTLTNTLLQGKLDPFTITLGRMVLNTTVGVLGLFDPATELEITRQHEDFGQTLGFYGMGPGPYFVLPILGPSTLRDTGGLIVDALTYSMVVGEIIDDLDMKDSEEDLVNYTLSALLAIDKRHTESFRYYESGSPFEYDLIRMLYLKKRELDISK
jgi:phospholipid-binding lipoprotein MlaA